jgi:phosphate transport system substrate-binding protein
MRERVSVFLALSVALLACKRVASEEAVVEAGAPSVLKVAGSSALLPFVAEAANAFMRSHPTAVTVEGGGSRAGLAQVAAGTIAIGTSDVFATGELAPKVEDHKVGVVAFVAMANRGPFDASIPSLSLAQLAGIFSGKIRDWAEVGGSAQPITIVNRAKNSGTRGAFGSIVLGGDNFATGSEEQESSALVQTMLLQKVGAISYLALSYRHADLKMFAVDGVEPTPENIERGAYPIWSYEHMYTRGPASGDARAFIEFVLSPAMQGAVLEHGGFIPIGAMKVARDHE